MYTILVVDDEESIRALYREEFEEEGELKDEEYYVALMAVHLFFVGWSEGDEELVLQQMTNDLYAQSDENPFGKAYEQIDLELERAVQVADNQWKFIMLETYRNTDGQTDHALYDLEVVSTPAGMRIASWQTVE